MYALHSAEDPNSQASPAHGAVQSGRSNTSNSMKFGGEFALFLLENQLHATQFWKSLVEAGSKKHGVRMLSQVASSRANDVGSTYLQMFATLQCHRRPAKRMPSARPRASRLSSSSTPPPPPGLRSSFALGGADLTGIRLPSEHACGHELDACRGEPSAPTISLRSGLRQLTGPDWPAHRDAKGSKNVHQAQ